MELATTTTPVVVPANGMTPQEKRHFGALERRIAAGLQTFREVGSALLEIRDGRLYRDSHSSFESYCNERWSLSQSRAYQLIDSARVVHLLGEPKDLTNEAQARELASLNAEDAHKVWLTVETKAKEAQKPVTASLIRQVRMEVTEPNGGVTTVELTSTDRLVQDMARLGATFKRWQASKPSRSEKNRVTKAKNVLVGLLT